MRARNYWWGLLFVGAACSVPAIQEQTQSFLAYRAPIELCANSIDDDGDLLVDEQQCLISETSTPVSGDGIVPELWNDNPSCSSVGFLTEFKINNIPSNGTYNFNGYSVTITNATGHSFDWSATVPLDAVLIKASNEANLYVYNAENYEDTGLGTVALQHDISHVSFCYRYALTVEKTAETYYTRTYEWDIRKDFDGSYTRFIGESVLHGYEVIVDQTVTDGGWRVSGGIDISNETPYDATILSVEDVVSPAISVEVDCGVTFPYVLHAGAALHCTYAADLPDAAARLNTVVVEAEGNVVGNSAEAPVIFGEPVIIGDPAVNILDTNGQAWYAEGDATFTYEQAFTCSTDRTDYLDGFYRITHLNTATIEETGQHDDAIVTVDCYMPLVSKDAATSYTREYSWTINKEQNGHYEMLPGDAVMHPYLVAVERSVEERDFVVYGAIRVRNPNPSAAMTVLLSDTVGGHPAVLYCGGLLIIPPGETSFCDYELVLPAKVDGLNVATVSFLGLDFTADALYAFGEPSNVVGFAAVNVDDTNGETWFTGGSASWPYEREFTCPTDRALYIDGIYELTHVNVATIRETGQHDDAIVTLRCFEPPSAAVVKATIEGPEEIGALPFVFGLYGPEGRLVESHTLNGAGRIEFSTELRREGRWMLREIVPEGWLSLTSIECPMDVAFPASAGLTFVCEFRNLELSRVEVLKLTNGSIDPTKDWTFALYAGAGGYGGTLLASASTFGDEDGVLDFGALDLSSLGAFTLCEENIPAGWRVLFEADLNGDGTVEAAPAYNPGVIDSGVLCLNFGAGTELALLPGETLLVQVDNQYPQGAPRTPGYWKNWSTCTNGNQVATAAKNGGWEEGFWLLDNVLDVAVGGGITWDDILADSFVFPITSCEVAVDILSARDISDGKAMSSDAAYKLARNLLAAQANFAAGALDCAEAHDAALAAERLLDQLNFNGTGSYLRRHNQATLQAEALRLANTLDIYNNGNLCQ